jgi:hypothetical protein
MSYVIRGVASGQHAERNAVELSEQHHGDDSMSIVRLYLPGGAETAQTSADVLR